MSYKPVSQIPFVYGQRGNREAVVCMLGGVLSSEFPFNPEDPASRDAALQAFDSWAIGLQTKIESRLQRRLTEKELLRGLAHNEDEDEATRARVKQEREAILNPPVVDTRNWAERALDAHKEGKKEERDPKQAFLEQQVERLKNEEAKKTARALMAADPRRSKTREHAQMALLSALFDSTMPASEVRAAAWRGQLAKEGDLKQYETETNQFQARHRERLQQLARPHIDGLTKHHAAIRDLMTPFMLPPTTVEYNPGPAIDPLAEAQKYGL